MVILSDISSFCLSNIPVGAVCTEGDNCFITQY